MKRYMWLLQLLADGSKSGGLTFQEIADKWDRSSLRQDLSGSPKLTKRTLYNHCRAIEEHFGVDIECRKGRGDNRYRILDLSPLKDGSVRQWAIESFALGTTLMDNADIADKIILEGTAFGQNMLPTVLKAIREQRLLTLVHDEEGEIATENVMPLCVRLYKREWFVVVREKGRDYLFSLHLEAVKLTDKHFEYPKDFSAEKFFENVAAPESTTGMRGLKPRKVVVRAHTANPWQLRERPLHHSQKEIASTDAGVDFEYNLIPGYGFISQILDSEHYLEVLEPLTLRHEIEYFLNMRSALYQKEPGTVTGKDLAQITKEYFHKYHPNIDI